MEYSSLVILDEDIVEYYIAPPPSLFDLNGFNLLLLLKSEGDDRLPKAHDQEAYQEGQDQDRKEDAREADARGFHGGKLIMFG
jgi:hypothetical protein